MIPYSVYWTLRVSERLIMKTRNGNEKKKKNQWIQIRRSVRSNITLVDKPMLTMPRTFRKQLSLHYLTNPYEISILVLKQLCDLVSLQAFKLPNQPHSRRNQNQKPQQVRQKRLYLNPNPKRLRQRLHNPSTPSLNLKKWEQGQQNSKLPVKSRMLAT